MRVLSNGIQQVFKAYAKQLRVEHAKGNDGRVRDTRAKGFEKVEISEEARTLAANLPEIVNRAPASKQDKAQPRSKKTLKSSENDEKETETSKASSEQRRNNEVEN